MEKHKTNELRFVRAGKTPRTFFIPPTPHTPQAGGKIEGGDKGKTLRKAEVRKERPEETPRLMALSG